MTRQDWATFLNYLLPNHVAAVNNNVADRKFRAEVVTFDRSVRAEMLDVDQKVSADMLDVRLQTLNLNRDREEMCRK